MKAKEITESTVAGSIASVAMPLGNTQKRNKPEKAPKVNKGKKYANVISEGKMKELAYDLEHMDPANFKKKYGKTKEEVRASLSEAKVEEAEVLVVPGMRKSKDNSFVPHDKDRRDHEVEMARSDLYATAKDAMRIYKLIKDRTEDQGLMGWQQSYITLAADYLNSVADSLEHDAKVAEVTGGVIAGGMSNFEEGKAEVRADLDQAIRDFLDKGGEITKGKPGGPTTRKQQIRSLVKNLGSSHIGKRGESPRGDKVGKGANLKGSTVAKLSGGMSAMKEGTDTKYAIIMKDTSGETVGAQYHDEKYTLKNVLSDILDYQSKGHKNLELHIDGKPVDWKELVKKQSVKEEKCPKCGGEMVSEELMNEKKDACYYKVKNRYKVWPSAYASGALVKCRKKGSKNWGKSKK